MLKQGAKKLIICVMTVLLVIVMAMPVFAAPANAAKSSGQTVKMGFFEFGGMLEGAKEGAVKRGYCYEYMMQLAVYNGWKYEFVYGSYSQLYEKLKNGEIDVLPYTNYNEQRGEEVLFSDNALADEEYFIAVRKDKKIKAEEGVKALKGMTISTITGADYNDLLRKYITDNKLNMKIKYYSDVNETWDALREGKVDATVYTSIAYSADSWKCVCSFGKKPTYIAVARDKKNLLSKINDSSALIKKENPAFIGDLQEKYFSDEPSDKTLTQEESKWINEHPVLHVGGFTNDTTDLDLSKGAEKAKGLTVDVVQGIIDRLNLGIRADYKTYDTVEQMEAAMDSGEIDVIYPFYPDFYTAQKHGLSISNDFRSASMELVYMKDTSYSEAINNVATPATRLGIYYVQQYYPNSDIVKATSVQDAVDKVRNGEAKGAIAYNEAIHPIKEEYPDMNSVMLVEGCGTCFATRTENAALIRVLNRGLHYFTAAEINAVAAKYNSGSNITTRAYLASHGEVLVMMAVIVAILILLVIVLMRMRRLKKKADEANQSKSTFLFNMSHDIRTPMNAVVGFTDQAIRHKDDPKALDDALDKVKASSGYLLGIVNDILDMAKIESGKLELNEQLDYVDHSHNTLLEMFGEEAAKKGIELHSRADIDDNYLWLDASRVSQILANLISNAVKYTEPGGDIWYTAKQIACDREGYARIVITIKDNGCGMSPEFLAKIFEAFERDQSAISSGAQGTGLGMAIVKKLADAMGGTIEIRSEVGVGTEVVFTVEHKIGTPEEIEEYNKKVSNASMLAGRNFTGKRILLVEDNELNREIAMDILEEKGFIVETAEDGRIAVDMINEIVERQDYQYYFAVLMDIQMPVMNGFEATKAIREIPGPENYRLPIIAMTANAFDEDRQNAIDAGMDDHIAKPIDVEKLFEALGRFL